MPEIESKLDKLARIIDGQVMVNPAGLKVCIKGIVAGFPARLEAVQATYPFGVSYYLETNHFSSAPSRAESFKLVIMPKYARGPLSVITRFLFSKDKGKRWIYLL